MNKRFVHIKLIDKLLFYFHIYSDITILDLDTGKTIDQISRNKRSRKQFE